MKYHLLGKKFPTCLSGCYIWFSKFPNCCLETDCTFNALQEGKGNTVIAQCLFLSHWKPNYATGFHFHWVLIIKTFLPYLISSANLRWEKIYSIHKEETLKWPKKTILKKWLNKRKATFFFKEGITQMITYFVIVLKRRMFYLSHF